MMVVAMIVIIYVQCTLYTPTYMWMSILTMIMMTVMGSQTVQIMVMSESKNDEDADGGETEVYNFKLKIDR